MLSARHYVAAAKRPNPSHAAKGNCVQRSDALIRFASAGDRLYAQLVGSSIAAGGWLRLAVSSVASAIVASPASHKQRGSSATLGRYP